MAGMYQGVPTVPRIGGQASSYVPFPQGSDMALFRRQVAPALGLAGHASQNPWLGLAQALNSYLGSSRSGIPGGVGPGTMFGTGFGSSPTPGGVPSRRTIYGPGPRAF